MSDLSSYVCSSDLGARREPLLLSRHDHEILHPRIAGECRSLGDGEAFRHVDGFVIIIMRGPAMALRCQRPVLLREPAAGPGMQHQVREDRERCRGFLIRIARTLHARSEEHTSELQSLMRISYAVFCLKKKKTH